MSLFNEQLRQVFFDTRRKSKSIYQKETEALIQATKLYEDASLLSVEYSPTQTIEFINIGTINAGLAGLKESKKVAILNFADAYEAGGLVFDGFPTQEECLCRCTNLYESLVKNECLMGYYEFNRNLDSDSFSDRLIYSPNVLVIKDESYRDLDNPQFLDVITIPFPLVTGATEEIYKKRVECILKSAVDNSVEYLVLGAIGCGAFGNPVEEVAKTFAGVLSTHKYIPKIVFAIRETEGSSNDNIFSLFKDVFCKHYKEG